MTEQIAPTAFRKLWKRAPHAKGPGAVHILESDERTFCAIRLADQRGAVLSGGRPDCVNCISRFNARRERAEEEREWRAVYEAYLSSEPWREKRALVMKRAAGLCEGCGLRPAIQAHHVTYKHLTNEFLWELRAVCVECHKRIHDEGKP